jgi:sirohydrochlorin ferrochelatase
VTISALTPAFLLATDLQPHEADWPEAERQAASVAAAAARILGFEPIVRVASVAAYPGEAVSGDSLAEVLSQQEAAEVFVLPAALDFNLWQREEIGRVLAEQRRARADVSIYHDDLDLGHPLLVQCFADCAAHALPSPQRAGVIVAASGHGDPGARAQSYRFMRLLWEQAGFGKGEVGFVRHAQPFLRLLLERCAAQPFEWALVPQAQWQSQQVEFMQVILGDFRHAHPESPQFHLADPPGNHPALTAWFAQRITRLWQEKRSREALKPIPARNYTYTFDICIRGCMARSPRRKSPYLSGSWDVGELKVTVGINAGVGADAGLPDDVRFASGIVKLVRRQIAEEVANPARPAIFLLQPEARALDDNIEPTRVPMLDNRLTQIAGRLWYVNEAVVSGKYLELDSIEDDALFRIVTDRLQLGDVPAAIVELRTKVPSVRFILGG